MYLSTSKTSKKQGKITPNGVSLEKHEMDTVVFLTSTGHNIELIPPSRIKGQRSADLIMEGITWEIKSPLGNNKKVLERILKKALRQSKYVIIDLRRIKLSESNCISTLEREFTIRKTLKHLKIITKSETIIDFKR